MIKSWLGKKCFSLVHRKNLVYNTCWEDPRLDRQALDLGPDDTVLVITSAGCNALDYALQSPKAVFAVDMNPLQNALLELKVAAIRTLEFDDFFRIFGNGFHPEWNTLYRCGVRSALPQWCQEIWDRRGHFFDGSGRRRSFYYRGTSGFFAWLIGAYLNRSGELRAAVDEILAAESVEQQTEIYHARNVSSLLFSKPLRWTLQRDTTMALLGVPRSQRMQIDRVYPGGISGFIKDRIEKVFTQIPLKDNYFWRVYLTGSYSPDCCPEYLRADNFESLKSGLVERVSTHNATVKEFLDGHQEVVSRFVLLDHMDWLYENHPQALRSEWQSILDRSAPHTRILWRSASLSVDFVDPLMVESGGRSHRIGDLLCYHSALAEKLHQTDRVHTYGSFYIADLMGVAA